MPRTHESKIGWAAVMPARTELLAGVVAGLTLLGAASAPTRAQVVESWTLTIDSSTTQPVATGLFGFDAADDVIVLAEGAVRAGAESEPYDQGWFGPAGHTRLSRFGQPVLNGMPFGALLGGFGADVTQFEQLGRLGAFGVAVGEVGEEFQLALNMSDDDLAALEGSITVTLVYVPAGSADVSEITITAASPDEVPTGLIAGDGDKFVVLPYAAARASAVGANPYSNGWFSTAGRPQLTRAGQPSATGPYGALYGKYAGGSSFYIGDGGCWTTQPADLGQELMVLTNMSAADRATLTGRFVANVIRVPAPAPAAVPDSDAIEVGLRSFPNPMNGQATIRYQLPQAGLARVRVADASGRWVRTLVDGTAQAGTHAIEWDGANDRGESLPAGTYFYQLSTDAGSRAGRIVITR